VAADLNIKKQYKEEVTKRWLPVYKFEGDDGSSYFVIEVRGVGLWGPVAGCVAFKEDLNTLQGIVFDHDAETPGLGGEIKKPWFQDQFKNKK